DYGGSITAAVELFAHLRLDERALFFHHDDEIEAFGEPVDDRRIERPHHADLEQADTQLRGSNLVDAEIVQRLADVEIALACRYDADLGTASAGQDDAVDSVGAGECGRGEPLVPVQPHFLLMPVVIGA